MKNMTRREVVIDALEFRRPAYVPWNWSMTGGCAARMKEHLGGAADLDHFVGNHIVTVGNPIGRFQPVDASHDRDTYGVIWDRSTGDIGVPVDWPLKRPEDLDGYLWPDASLDDWYAGMAEQLAANRELFSVYALGFSLFERAWTLRGMDNLLMDMIERPEWVERLLATIVEHDLAQVRRALSLGVDAVYFGDDYGMQHGRIMGDRHWRHFIKPCLARLFGPVREAGKFVFMHSCGDVDDLFDDLVEVGLSCFNPFQPEVMDVFALKKAYHGRLAFHGGLSIQKTLPFGSPDDVRRATKALLEAGREGGYIFSPSHDVPRDVPPENLVAMMEVLRSQPGSPQAD